jgi:hypothetical protein
MMTEYNPSSPIECLKQAFYYLQDMIDTYAPLVALRVLLWTKEGIVIGVWLYANLRGEKI